MASRPIRDREESAGQARGSETLWAVTTYFNPAGFRSRRFNYRVFRRHLQIPLLTVAQEFGGVRELEDTDADILIRVTDGDVMWQKERLFNLALRYLPPQCKKIAWLDCDVVFPDAEWSAKLSELLDRWPVVQPFLHARHLTPHQTRMIADISLLQRPESVVADETSVVDLWRRGVKVRSSRHLEDRPEGPRPISGLAWATRREVSERLPFFDHFVVGSGDAAFWSGISNDRSIYALPRWPRPLAESFEEWAATAFDVVKGQIASLDSWVYALWHGKFVDRNYVGRWSILARHDFDPHKDIKLSAGGAWSWASEKTEMHAAIREYFHERREECKWD